jgi:thiosulfate/3-mercaptopyruvate sulfurtransferase
MANTVDVTWLHEHLGDEEIVIADCRFILGQPDAGAEAYAAGHLPGAVYFDLERDLSGKVGAHGGRHPLPEPEQLARKLSEAGVDDTRLVVAYDDQGGAMAARLWWILKYYGHERVRLLDGGLQQWVNAGYPLTRDVPAPKKSVFYPRIQSHWLVDAGGVKQRLGRADTVLIDSREEKRFWGLEEPIDRVGGHIPGARNYFWKRVFTPEGLLKEKSALQELFGGLDARQEIIVYCGSGVTACPNVLALTEAGFTNVKLYGGSWSDWISYPDHPIATGPDGSSVEREP